MQWIKTHWLIAKQRQLALHETHRKLSLKEIGIIYGFICLFIIGSLVHLEQMGFTMSTYLIQNVISGEQNYRIDRQLFYSWMYTLTGVEWNHTERFVFNLTPARKHIYTEKVATGEIKGYFNDDRDTDFIFTQPKIWHNNILDYALFNDTDYVYKNYMSASSEFEFGTDMLQRWNFYDLVTKPITLPKNQNGPQILIFHTHCNEEYVGGATVVDVGEALKEKLEKDYGIGVLHISDNFYTITETGGYSTNGAYENMEPVIKKILEENPSISIVIDLHRDGIDGGKRLVANIDGKDMAKIMFVNGLCMNRTRTGTIEDKEGLPNPYIGENLAFSLQMMVALDEMYPGLTRKIYLREWRFSTHMAPYSILMEWGFNTNTSEDAFNAVDPVAKTLASVLHRD